MGFILSPVGWFIGVVLALLVTWGFAPQLVSGAVKAFARMIGITDEPNIEFGHVYPDTANGSVPYQTLYHVECVNRSRRGWRGRLRRTRDAEGCRAKIEIMPSSGSGISLRDDAIITLGAISPLTATLYVDKPAWIPLYWIATTNGSQTPPGPAAEKGYYMAGAGFWVNKRWFKYHLPPDIYRVNVELICNQKPVSYEFELEVPF